MCWTGGGDFFRLLRAPTRRGRADLEMRRICETNDYLKGSSWMILDDNDRTARRAD